MSSIDEDEFAAQGLTGDDLDALDGMWMTMDGEPIMEGPVMDLQAPTRPESAPVSLEAAKQALTPSNPDIFPWRQADEGTAAQIARQWPQLRAFVEWTVLVYRLQTVEHKPCWWQHPEIVLEWTGLRHLYDLSWNPEDSGAGPNNWHYWLEAGRRRLSNAWVRHARCDGRMHVEPEPIVEIVTAISDEQWAALTRRDAAYEPPQAWPFTRGDTA